MWDAALEYDSNVEGCGNTCFEFAAAGGESMDRPTKMPEYGADTNPLSRTEHLRSLKRENESRTLSDPLPPIPAAATNLPGSGHARVREKRRRPRLRCEGGVAFRTDGVDMRTWATFTDISLNGCYVELAATLAVNTSVNLALDLRGVHAEVKGIVRTSYPLIGMGIEFTGILEPEKLALEEMMRRLDGTPGPVEPATLTVPAPPSLLMIVDPGAALNAVAKFFQNNQALTREQFAELMGKSRDSNLSVPR